MSQSKYGKLARFTYALLIALFTIMLFASCVSDEATVSDTNIMNAIGDGESSDISTPTPIVTVDVDWPDTPVSDFDFQFDVGLGGAVITRYTGNNALRVRIPDTIDGEPVVGIAGGSNTVDGAFSHAAIISVYIPSTVTYIGVHAFARSHITSIEIPNSVTEIHRRAFWHTEIGGTLVIPDSVTYIGRDAFSHTNVEFVILGAGVNYIGRGAFLETPLTHISVSPDNPTLVDIDGVVFIIDISAWDSEELEALIEVSHDALDGNELKIIYLFPNGRYGHYRIPYGTTLIAGIAFNFSMTSVQNPLIITVPGSINHITRSAFSYHASLAEVIIEEGVLSIGSNAFSNARNLTHVNLPYSIMYISNNAFLNTGLDEDSRQRVLQINPNAQF